MFSVIGLNTATLFRMSAALHLACFLARHPGSTGAAGFPARYSTPCPACGREIQAGERITMGRSGRPPKAVHGPGVTPQPRTVTPVTTVVEPPAPEAPVVTASPVVTAAAPVARLEHRAMATLRRALRAKRQAWLYGPSGTGKSTACEIIAKEMGLDFACASQVESAHELMGYMGAHGYVSTEFRRIFEHGGIFLLDEIAGSDPGALTAFGTALANGHCAFPDGTVKRHPNCLIVAGDNTNGTGPTPRFPTRRRVCASTRSRFVFIAWEHDDSLERGLYEKLLQSLDFKPPVDWCARVQRVRAAVESRGGFAEITTRATLDGTHLLAVGSSVRETEELALRCGMTDAQWESVR